MSTYPAMPLYAILSCCKVVSHRSIMIFYLLVHSGCSNRDDGLYPDTEDCSKFIQCSNGQAYSKNCAVGLYFNDKLKVCDWPSNVNCHGGEYRRDEKYLMFYGYVFFFLSFNRNPWWMLIGYGLSRRFLHFLSNVIAILILI